MGRTWDASWGDIAHGKWINGGEVSRDMSRVMRGIYTVNGKMRKSDEWMEG